LVLGFFKQQSPSGSGKDSMNINELTIGQLKEIQSFCGSKMKESSALPVEVGKNYFIRTVTLYYTGKVKAIYPESIVLSDAAWVSDTGRFYDFLKNGTPNEVEPFVNDVIIPNGGIIDITSWEHDLLKTQK